MQYGLLILQLGLNTDVKFGGLASLRLKPNGIDSRFIRTSRGRKR